MSAGAPKLGLATKYSLSCRLVLVGGKTKTGSNPESMFSTFQPGTGEKTRPELGFRHHSDSFKATAGDYAHHSVKLSETFLLRYCS